MPGGARFDLVAERIDIAIRLGEAALTAAVSALYLPNQRGSKRVHAFIDLITSLIGVQE